MKPKFKIIADKTDITNLLNGRLLSLSVTDEIGLVSDAMTMELDDREGVLEIPPRGAELEVFLGYDNDPLYPMGKFIVDEAELKSPPETMSITARASNSAFRDMGAFKSPRTYAWEKYTVIGILQTIAKRYGLTASAADVFKNIVVSHLDQTDESDCAFIQRLATDYDASVKVAGGNLLFIEPLSGKFPNGTPMPVIKIQATDIIGYQMRLAERGKYGKAIAKYYDFDLAEEKQASVGAEAPIFTLREVFSNRSVALSRAKNKLTEITSGTRALSLDLIGNPLIGGESKIELIGTRAEIAGEWVIKSAKHLLDSSGYKTSVESTRPKGWQK